ncbi:MAG TPA: glutamate--tRNA ligase [Casimicrobiaceae bacterium]|nr:glutamate--tRNA ligase [Casimicrobiaceae bacterium]
MSVRTRFAPSPTGFLHLGNIRSALFPWAFARHHGGTFILRIEDTDLERSTPEATQAIVETMQWLGLGYDEGPYHQMQRMDRYRAVLDDMLARGLAYRCYTTPAELDALRAEQMARGEKPRYDGRWRPENAQGKTPPAGVAPVYRFRNPDDGVVAWDDAVKGRIEIANAELDDLVIARADHTPTYNFCVVVDDVDMRITHVIRGDDHVNNTPRQINIMHALCAAPPVYAHLPTVLTPAGERLSKRHGARGVLQYRDDGYVPEAIVNYLARLGWAHGDAEVFDVDAFVQWFDLSGLTPSPARFDPEKLRWLNHEHLKRLDMTDLGRRLAPFLQSAGIDPTQGPSIERVAALLRERAPTLVEMAEAALYLYRAPSVDPFMLGTQLNDANRAALVELHDTFASIAWERGEIGAAIKAAASRHALKAPQVMMPLRALVAGTLKTPAIDAVLELVGREATRERVARGLALNRSAPASAG